MQTFQFHSDDPKSMQTMQARVALMAKQTQDPRYEELVKLLMERMQWSREEVEQGINVLASGLY